MTHLVAPIHADDPHGVRERLRAAAAAGADAVELRVDRVPEAREAVAAWVAESPLPCLVTCRHASEGGGFNGPESVRIALYAHLARQAKRPLAVDVEAAHFRAHREAWATALGPLLAPAAPGGPQLVLSAHDFVRRPDDLADRLAHMLDEPLCGVPKLAWRAQGLEDVALAARLVRLAPKPIAALPMGEAGLPARVLARKWGAFMTFASLDATQATAPGQPTLAEIRGLYRWDALRPSTRVYGVVGCPVGHSKSPLIHNAGFAEVGFDGVYLPLRIEPDAAAFDRALSAWLAEPSLDFHGASVTIPHKENLLRFVREHGGAVAPLAGAIGAANTLVRAGGRLLADNSDHAGILAALGAHARPGARAAVVGAGGAARAAVAALAGAGCEVTVFNRSPDKAEALAAAFGARAAALADLGRAQFDLLVNGTPLGMHPQVEGSPLEDGHPALRPGTVVFDTVYNPRRTRLLAQAEAAGCHAIQGIEMFIEQAASQFEAWTGRPAPKDVFRRALG